jgi:hypothetical protein
LQGEIKRLQVRWLIKTFRIFQMTWICRSYFKALSQRSLCCQSNHSFKPKRKLSAQNALWTSIELSDSSRQMLSRLVWGRFISFRKEKRRHGKTRWTSLSR